MTDLSNLPSVTQLLQQPPVVAVLTHYDRAHITAAARAVVADLRDQIRGGDLAADRGEMLVIACRRLVECLSQTGRSLRPVINATGVILHTGLGRAPLAPAARQALAQAADRYCNLELDLATGERGRRMDHVDAALRRLTGAEATAVVNNNAAAVLLLLHALAAGRQVVISRGQLVEIGGSFRMPDIIAASGAIIQEVGTTNRTHLHDFAKAINADTALLLVVHPSNYRVAGFTAEPNDQELIELGKKAGVPVAFDLGGGTLRDLDRWGLPHEPVVADSLAAGYDVVTFSGDKILGGPQCGILAGRTQWMEQIQRSPMMRALRCGKLTMAALEATLDLYRLDDVALSEALPTLQMMTQPLDVVRERAEVFVAQLDAATKDGLGAQIVASKAQAGSGALPVEELDSFAVACGAGMAEALARNLRQDPERAAVGRIGQDRLLLDMRTVRSDEVAALAACLARAYKALEPAVD